jgi:SAM-dependent methyltransferase
MNFNKIKKNKLARKIGSSKIGRKVLQFLEILIWGGRRRRDLSKKILNFQYKSKFRHDRVWAKEPPHFSDFENFENLFENSFSLYTLLKGYLAVDVLKKEDKLLDIGTGSGFFPSRFFSSKCKHIDAIDIEESAIDYAKNYNYADNINFIQQDAVNTPFPSEKYDVIIWDSAIGHFHPETTNKMLNKILNSLDKNGIFIGCEILGSDEGIDHLQFFENLNDLGALLKKYFRYVYLKELHYPTQHDQTFIRRQGFWRCCNTEIASIRFVGDWNKI